MCRLITEASEFEFRTYHDKTLLVRKARENHLIHLITSTFLAETQSTVSGFCYALNRDLARSAYQSCFIEPIQCSNFSL